jgi:hypothetical protein
VSWRTHIAYICVLEDTYIAYICVLEDTYIAYICVLEDTYIATHICVLSYMCLHTTIYVS